MALDRALSQLSQQLERLEEELRSLHLTLIEDAPVAEHVALVDGYADATADLKRVAEESLTAAQGATQWLSEPPETLGRHARNALAKVHASTIAMQQIIAERLAAYDRLHGLASQGGEWVSWTKVVTAAVEDCRKSVTAVERQLLECWEELALWLSAVQLGAAQVQKTVIQPPPISLSNATPSQLAQDAVRRVLGWRYRSDDPKGFLAELNKSFALTEIEGHLEWEFQPNSYQVQADLGEITGAQASIYARAKVAHDQVLPLLDGLVPLRPDQDPQDIEALRGSVRKTLTELVDELGETGGPRIARVDALFEDLVGAEVDPGDGRHLGGRMKELRERFGLARSQVNTVEDEQNLTNFLILVDYVYSLWVTWKLSRAYFLWLQQPKHEPLTKGQLLSLSRRLSAMVTVSQSLDALAESVREAYDAMDSVFFGPAERQTVELLSGEDRISVAELLGWIRDFATSEARHLLQASGKDGVETVRDNVWRLEELVEQAMGAPAAPNPTTAPKVRRAWERILDRLERTRASIIVACG